MVLGKGRPCRLTVRTLAFHAGNRGSIPLGVTAMKKNNSGTNDKYIKPAFWWVLLNLWTLIVFAAVIWDFMTNNSLGGTVNLLLALYVGILSIYSAEKEFRRWHSFHRGRHPGELYVIAWTVIIVFIFLCDLLLKKSYIMPEAIVSTYIVVVGILAITKNSKRVFLERRQSKS